MGYYKECGRRRYRSWLRRGFGRSSAPSKHSALFSNLDSVVGDIRSAFPSLEDDALDELLHDYGAIHCAFACGCGIEAQIAPRHYNEM